MWSSSVNNSSRRFIPFLDITLVCTRRWEQVCRSSDAFLMLFMSLSDSGVGAGPKVQLKIFCTPRPLANKHLCTFQTDCLYELNTDKRAENTLPHRGTALLLPLLVNYLLLQPDSLSFSSHRSRPAQQQQHCRGENGLCRKIQDIHY